MTGTDLAVRSPATPAVLADKIAYAEFLAESDLLPKVYQRKPANILLVVEYGEYLGIPAAAALRLIHVIDNKPVASAELLAGRVHEAGHRMRVSYDQPTKTAWCSIWRRDDPRHEFHVEWSWERASHVTDRNGQKLTDKANWRNYYPAMLKWRATTECIRDACPEVALGVSYTAEELGSQEFTDDEADDLGLMTRHQRVEHNGLRRMGEPPAGAVQKTRERDPDDPWAEDPTAASGAAPSAPTDGPAPAAPPASSSPPASTRRGGSAPSEAATDRLATLFRQVPLGDEADLATFVAWVTGHDATGPLTAADVKNLATMLEGALKAAGGDGEQAAASLWDQHKAATGG